MEIYFLKSAACLAVLLLFYKLLLEKESMHVFKRFYLLFSVVISFAVPYVSFTTYVEVPAEPIVPEQSFEQPFTYTMGSTASPAAPVSPWPYLLWSIYGLGVLFFSWKFGRNLIELIHRIKRNTKIRTGSVTNVLLREDIVPHTFLDYIFLNKKKFEAHAIPQEVFEHEQAHAKQMHSYDILFMELLQVVFWFHPLLYLTKNAIKLNHEFLADKMVLKKGIATAQYQQMLLAFSSGASHGSLAHPINYSFIKKRFTVMKTQTSKRAIWLRSLLLLPLAAVLLYGFSTKEVVHRNSELSTLISNSEIFELLVDDSGNIFYGKTKTSLEDIQELLEANNYSSFSISLTENTSEVLVGEILTIMFNNKLEGSVSSCSTTNQELQGTATAEMVKWYNEVAKQINSLPDPKIKSEDVSKLLRIYHWMSPQQKKAAEPYPKEPIESVYRIVQETATPEMVREYNKLAKYYNSRSGLMVEDASGDFEKMRRIYELMTTAQKKEAEPFPKDVEVIEIVEDEDLKGEQQVPEPPVPPTIDVPAPEAPVAPPAPPTPAEHIEELAAEGASFYLDGAEISSQRAIEIVKDSKNISIHVSDSGSGKVVKLSNRNKK